MPYELVDRTKNIKLLIEELKKQEDKRAKLVKNGMKKDELDLCNKDITNILNKLKDENSKIYFLMQAEPKIETKKFITPMPVEFLKLSKEEVKQYLKELNITKVDIKRFLTGLKKREMQMYERTDYTLYSSSKFGKVANRFVEPLTIYLTRKFPDLFKPMNDALRMVNINMLSKTYVSTIFFSGIIAFFAVGFIFGIILFSIVKGIIIGIVGMITTVFVMYYYPKTMINARRRRIKNELPFAIVHMAAVAGSGTQPINMFILVLESGEYKELSKEIKKIINYVNIFGYNLSTALKLVAASTPSPEFAELLNGIVSTIETGGDLRGYLDGKAVDTLATYKLERKKYVEMISTYSDIYTSILIAAPLLFVTTLTIINVIGGQLGGLSVSTIATIGTFVVIPLLNIGFMVFLNITQAEI
ncbi:MAG: type II secretion system F family protein [Nanoarchaeota archaeon]